MARWKVLHFLGFWNKPGFKVNISFTEPFPGDKGNRDPHRHQRCSPPATAPEVIFGLPAAAGTQQGQAPSSSCFPISPQPQALKAGAGRKPWGRQRSKSSDSVRQGSGHLTPKESGAGQLSGSNTH